MTLIDDPVVAALEHTAWNTVARGDVRAMVTLVRGDEALVTVFMCDHERDQKGLTYGRVAALAQSFEADRIVFCCDSWLRKLDPGEYDEWSGSRLQPADDVHSVDALMVLDVRTGSVWSRMTEYHLDDRGQLSRKEPVEALDGPVMAGWVTAMWKKAINPNTAGLPGVPALLVAFLLESHGYDIVWLPAGHEIAVDQLDTYQ